MRTPFRSASPADRAMTSHSGLLTAFDPATALADLDNDADLLTAIVDAFRDDCPRMLAAMQHAVENVDAAALKLVTHEFKGAVSNFSEPRTLELVGRLELLADRGTLGGAATLLSELRVAVQQLQACFAAFLAQLAGCAS
jgi:two-component system, sensor histidine kinase and response regulator